ncbi:unnamed protein product [Ixodes persulcatus]
MPRHHFCSEEVRSHWDGIHDRDGPYGPRVALPNQGTRRKTGALGLDTAEVRLPNSVAEGHNKSGGRRALPRACGSPTARGSRLRRRGHPPGDGKSRLALRSPLWRRRAAG